MIFVFALLLVCQVKCIFILICIALIMSEVGHPTLSLLAICIFPPALLESVVFFYDSCVCLSTSIGLLFFFSLICVSCMQIKEISLLSACLSSSLSLNMVYNVFLPCSSVLVNFYKVESSCLFLFDFCFGFMLRSPSLT